MNDKNYDTTFFVHPKEWDSNRMSVTLKGHEDCPVDPKVFAKMILDTVKLLEAVDADTNPENKKSVGWMLIEAAVIGKDASFTLQGVDRDALKKHNADARKKSVASHAIAAMKSLDGKDESERNGAK